MLPHAGKIFLEMKPISFTPAEADPGRSWTSRRVLRSKKGRFRVVGVTRKWKKDRKEEGVGDENRGREAEREREKAGEFETKLKGRH